MDAATLKLFGLAWLALPVTALDWGLAWGRLPERVVTRTGLRGEAIGWASRGDAMALQLEVIIGVLVLGTLICGLTAAARPDRARAAGGVLIALGVLVTVAMNGVLWGMHVP